MPQVSQLKMGIVVVKFNTSKCLLKFFRYIHLINGSYDDHKKLRYIKIYETLASLLSFCTTVLYGSK